MTVSEVRKKLFDCDAFVISELKKIQTLYELKRVIRYGHLRQQEQHTESVAEHIFGMHCLVDYFLPLEDLENQWNQVRIRAMVQYHDLDEILTGDTVGYLKGKDESLREEGAFKEVIAGVPLQMRSWIEKNVHEYKSQRTPEAKFVRAVDKIEPVFHLYNETGKSTLDFLQTTKQQHDRIKYPAIESLPVIKRFAEVMSEQFEQEGFFHPSS